MGQRRGLINRAHLFCLVHPGSSSKPIVFLGAMFVASLPTFIVIKPDHFRDWVLNNAAVFLFRRIVVVLQIMLSTQWAKIL